MKTIGALLLGLAIASGPAWASESSAVGKPILLAQKSEAEKTDKGKSDAKKPANERSNKGGATRGDERSDQVQGMKKDKKDKK